MKLCALSDLHGYLPTIPDKNFDYLFIGGDLVPLNVQSRTKETLKWVREEFIPWLWEFTGQTVFIIPGNHDLHFPNHAREIVWPENVVYLENEYWEDCNIQVYGTPLCKIFGNWAYMETQEKQNKIFSEFEGFKDDDRVKVILSHDAPYGCSDLLLDRSCPWYTTDHIGNPALRTLIERTHPDINFHGHLHSTNHEEEMLGETRVYCTSIKDERYNPTFTPLFLEC